jgi:high-affinity K+ transport system ATPase subunit B
MSRKQLALFEPSLVRQALMDAVKKLSPRVQWHNPVMFIVWAGSVLTTALAIAMGTGHHAGKCDVYRRHQPVAVVYRAVRQLCGSAGGRPE